MEKLILRLSFSEYILEGYQGEAVRHLSMFLSELGQYVLGFKKWALDPDDRFSDLDWSVIRKEGNYVIMEMKNAESPLLFRLSIDRFIQLLDSWRDLQRLRPGLIVITYDGSNCSIWGENFPVPAYSVFDSEYWPSDVTFLEYSFELALLPWGDYGWPELLVSTMGVLPIFLVDDVCSFGVSHFKAWLASENEQTFNGESVFIIKRDNLIILKSVLFFKYHDTYFAMTREQFAKMLDDWEMLMKSKPEKIMVHCKDGNVVFDVQGPF